MTCYTQASAPRGGIKGADHTHALPARLTLVTHKARQCNGCKVAYSGLVRGSVLHNLCAEVGTADSAQVALVAFPVAGILVQHEGHACLHLHGKGIRALYPAVTGDHSMAILPDTVNTILHANICVMQGSLVLVQL